MNCLPLDLGNAGFDLAGCHVRLIYFPICWSVSCSKTSLQALVQAAEDAELVEAADDLACIDQP